MQSLTEFVCLFAAITCVSDLVVGFPQQRRQRGSYDISHAYPQFLAAELDATDNRLKDLGANIADEYEREKLEELLADLESNDSEGNKDLLRSLIWMTPAELKALERQLLYFSEEPYDRLGYRA